MTRRVGAPLWLAVATLVVAGCARATRPPPGPAPGTELVEPLPAGLDRERAACVADVLARETRAHANALQLGRTAAVARSARARTRAELAQRGSARASQAALHASGAAARAAGDRDVAARWARMAHQVAASAAGEAARSEARGALAEQAARDVALSAAVALDYAEVTRRGAALFAGRALPDADPPDPALEALYVEEISTLYNDPPTGCR